MDLQARYPLPKIQRHYCLTQYATILVLATCSVNRLASRRIVGRRMSSGEDREAEAIASEWGIDVSLLDGVEWTIDTIVGNDDHEYGYIVNFDSGTDPDILSALGLAPGEFTRRLSLNAFDQPDEEESYKRNRSRRAARNRAAFAGDAFAGHAFATDSAALSEESDDGIFSLDQPFPDISGFLQDLELVEPIERPTDGRRAYYLDDDRFTPSQFRRLSKRRQVEAMAQWFHENYEDPAVRMPYESAEGGYQWIWGGPYDPVEQISDEFADVSDQASIEEAAALVTSDGLFDWAPKARREDYDQDVDLNEPGRDKDWNDPPSVEDFTNTIKSRRDPSPAGEANLVDEAGQALTDEHGREFIVDVPIARRASSTSNVGSLGSDVETRDFHQELLEKVERLEASLQTYRENLPPRGHNHPPELVEPDPISPAEVRVVLQVAVDIRTEAERTQPDPVRLEAQASKLRAVARSILAWFGRKGDLAVDSAIKWGVPATGAAFVLAGPEKVYANLLSVAESASAWAQHLMGAF